MRLSLYIETDENNRPIPDQCRVTTSSEFGEEELERVTAVQFEMTAGDMIPKLTITVIPEHVEIHAIARIERETTDGIQDSD